MPLILHSIVIETSRSTALSCRCVIVDALEKWRISHHSVVSSLSGHHRSFDLFHAVRLFTIRRICLPSSDCRFDKHHITFLESWLFHVWFAISCFLHHGFVVAVSLLHISSVGRLSHQLWWFDFHYSLRPRRPLLRPHLVAVAKATWKKYTCMYVSKNNTNQSINQTVTVIINNVTKSI